MSTATNRHLTLAELQHIDALISIAQEQGLTPDERLRASNDNACCGAIAAEAKGKLTFSDHDREIIRKIGELQQKLDSMPTLGQLIEARGKLLREAKSPR